MSNSAMNPSQFVVVTACVLLLAGCGEEGGSTTPPAPTSTSPVSDMPSAAISPIPLTTGFSAGSPLPLLSITTEVAPLSGDGTGNFRTICHPTHMANDDPIVFPGQPGRAHLHTFFGNAGTNAFSTTDSLLNTGNSSCRGGIVNRSAYWVPSMIDTRTNMAIMPTVSHFYYKSGYRGVRPEDIQPFPRGLRMIAGDPRMTSSNFDPDRSAGRFMCHFANTQALLGPNIQNCAVGDHMVQEIYFPQCWDGVNLDSPDHASHMAYPNSASGCPATHPVPLIEISVHIHYRITEPNQATHWRLSSDNYSGPAGYSNHSDWWNGWRQSDMESIVRNCINRGLDCHSHLLGDGRAIDDLP